MTAYFAPPPPAYQGAYPARAAPTALSVSGSHSPSNDEAVKEANNPLASKLSLNLQNYYVGSLSEAPDASADTLFARVNVPIWRFLTRVSLPMMTQSSAGASTSGIGDLNAFVTFTLTNPGSPVEFGLGPLYVAPTASHDALGTGKHQLGGAVILVHKQGPLLVGSLVQYQASIAGDESRAETSILTPQLLLVVELGAGVYFRSTPVATFDFESGSYGVPLGAGIGKVVVLGSTVLNFFLEPQYTFLSHGPGQPLLQIYSGINTQFKL